MKQRPSQDAIVTGGVPGWRRSRALRKFLRQRLAVIALAAILIYLAAAAAVMLGAVTVADTEMVVGPRSTPGLFQKQTREKRLEDAEWLVDKVKRELKSADAEQSLRELRIGRRRIANAPLAEIRRLTSDADRRIDVLARSTNLDDDEASEPELRALEQTVEKLCSHPPGLSGLVHKSYLLLGVDRQGRSILLRCLYSTKIALQVGMVTALVSVVIGGLLGAAAGYFGGTIDHVITWLYTTLSSIPNTVLLVLLAYVFTSGPLATLEGGLAPIYAALCATFWVGPCRVIRGETLKLKELEYVQAATTIGLGRLAIMFRHVLPNTSHLLLINFSLLFILAIKSEVILTFLNLGVKEGASWGIMISHSVSEVVNGFFWQIGSATAFMFVLVLSFNILSDALQDAFDPKQA